MKNSFVLLFMLFGLDLAGAAEIYPHKIIPVKSAGPTEKTIQKQVYKKISSVTELKYSNVKAGVDGNPGDTLILDLNKKALSFSIVIFTQGKVYGYVYELRDPEGLQIISSRSEGLSEEVLRHPEFGGRAQTISLNPSPAEYFKDISVTAVPNSDIVKIKPGKWKFSIAIEEDPTSESAVYDVSVFVKSTSVPITPSTRGQITASFSATAAAQFGSNKKEIETILDTPMAYLKSVGIDLVTKGFEVLPSEYDQLCEDQSFPCFKKLEELLRSARTEKRMPGQIRVFFTRRNNYSHAGIANLNGSVSSLFSDRSEMFDGVFIMTDLFKTAFAQATFLHELGHHFGLLHTNLDSISDTLDFDHVLHGNQNPKDKNLMNPGSGPYVLTEGQRYVLLRAAAIELYDLKK